MSEIWKELRNTARDLCEILLIGICIVFIVFYLVPSTIAVVRIILYPIVLAISVTIHTLQFLSSIVIHGEYPQQQLLQLPYKEPPFTQCYSFSDYYTDCWTTEGDGTIQYGPFLPQSRNISGGVVLWFDFVNHWNAMGIFVMDFYTWWDLVNYCLLFKQQQQLLWMGGENETKISDEDKCYYSELSDDQMVLIKGHYMYSFKYLF